jgi:arylsulfatase A-like enzyme
MRWLTILLWAQALTLGASTQPNLVVIVIDDMGWQDTSVAFHTEVTPLNRLHRTPAMERLAAEGLKFTQAYASAVCSPSRVSLLTGMNAARHGVTNWTLHAERSPDQPHPQLTLPDWPRAGLAAQSGTPHTVVATTLPALLRAVGYRTIHIGKAHFGAIGTPGADPRNLGFDLSIAGHAAGGPGSFLGEKNYSARWRGGEVHWDVPDLSAHAARGINLTEALTLEAVQAVEACVKSRKPFFLHLSHYAVHAPWEADARFIARYEQAGLKGREAAHASMVEAVDKSVGDVLRTLDRLGIADSTLVILVSDNGVPAELPRNFPLRGHKLSPYEGGIRVPALVRWPGVVKPGRTETTPVIIEDIFPTLLEAAGITASAPLPITQKVDGLSWLPLLNETATFPAARPLLFHFPNFYNGQQPYSVVLQEDWKLIHSIATGELELYHLKQDLGERNNLIQREPKRAADLASLLARELRSRGALMPTLRGTGELCAYPGE